MQCYPTICSVTEVNEGPFWRCAKFPYTAYAWSLEEARSRSRVYAKQTMIEKGYRGELIIDVKITETVI